MCVLCNTRILMLRADYHPTTQAFLGRRQCTQHICAATQRHLAYLKLLCLTDDLLIKGNLAKRRARRLRYYHWHRQHLLSHCEGDGPAYLCCGGDNMDGSAAMRTDR